MRVGLRRLQARQRHRLPERRRHIRSAARLTTTGAAPMLDYANPSAAEKVGEVEP